MDAESIEERQKKRKVKKSQVNVKTGPSDDVESDKETVSGIPMEMYLI